MTDTEYYDDTVADDEDELIESEDLEVVDPALDTIYNLEVVSCRRKILPARDGEDDDPDELMRVINVQLVISEGEFEGERSFHTFWMGPKGPARLPQHKRARKSFNKFFEACTGEKIGKGSTVNPRACEGAAISAKYVDASYPDRDNPGQRKNEGMAKWDDFSWAAPVEVDYESSYDGEEPV